MSSDRSEQNLEGKKDQKSEPSRLAKVGKAVASGARKVDKAMDMLMNPRKYEGR